MATQHTVPWNKVDQSIPTLETDVEHEIWVQREAIPLIFVPGIMGSRLRRTGTSGTGDGPDGLPNLRWDAGDHKYMAENYFWRYAEHRKQMLVGTEFNSSFLEVDNANPVGDGFQGIMQDYRPFLESLRGGDWGPRGPLSKIFVFPVYAFGYNWTDSNENSGTQLAQRIKDIIDEAKSVIGFCEKVILITHSMGGLVARAASQLSGAEGSILGIVHGVQPVTGAAAAYWRIKAGFEGEWKFSAVLGNNGKDVTGVLGNIPGGLELLPNKNHRANDRSHTWLKVTEDGKTLLALPTSDPYEEIYRVKAVVEPAKNQKPSNNAYWGLVDPNLLDLGNATAATAAAPSSPNAIDAANPPSTPWDQYLRMLKIAEAFHEKLGNSHHKKTFCFRGTQHRTADVVEMKVESNWMTVRNYPTRGFRGFFTSAAGSSMQAVLQDRAGWGDGTVPLYSAGALNASGKPFPADQDISLLHQPAYEIKPAQTFTIKAIMALCKQRYEERRKGG